jgi:hypothetical protein
VSGTVILRLHRDFQTMDECGDPVRVVAVFVDELDLGELGFSGVDPEASGRSSYHLAQDTFCVGNLKGVGRIYQQI